MSCSHFHTLILCIHFKRKYLHIYKHNRRERTRLAKKNKKSNAHNFFLFSLSFQLSRFILHCSKIAPIYLNYTIIYLYALNWQQRRKNNDMMTKERVPIELRGEVNKTFMQAFEWTYVWMCVDTYISLYALWKYNWHETLTLRRHLLGK